MSGLLCTLGYGFIPNNVLFPVSMLIGLFSFYSFHCKLKLTQKDKKIKDLSSDIARLKESNKPANSVNTHIIPTESFQGLDYSCLKVQAQRWADRHPEAKIERIVLYNYASSLQKPLKGYVSSKYFIVFETPKEANTNELESDTEYYQTVKDGYKSLMCADFDEVYKKQPIKEKFKHEWRFFVKKPSEEMPKNVMVNEPFWVLYP